MTRGRKPLIRPTRSLHIHIDAELAEAIDRRLWSEAENRVPKGAYQQFLTEAAIRVMRQIPLDLSPYAGSMPSEHVAYAYQATREVLKSLLERHPHADSESGDALESSEPAREGGRGNTH